MDNWKKIGLWLVVVIIILVVFKPLRSRFIAGLHEERQAKRAAIEEREILGEIYGYNVRVKEVQSLLKEKGFDPGKIDGRMGKSTRMAIEKFQIETGEKPTGFLNKTTWFKLEEAKSVSLVNKAKEDQTKKEVAKDKLQTEIMEYRLRNKDRIKAVQLALKNAGFDPGPIDGKMGEKTKQAVMAFQKKKGLTPDGVVGTKTWEELNKFLTRKEGGVR